MILWHALAVCESIAVGPPDRPIDLVTMQGDKKYYPMSDSMFTRTIESARRVVANGPPTLCKPSSDFRWWETAAKSSKNFGLCVVDKE